MIVVAFASLYFACTALIVAVWVQDRRRAAARNTGRSAPDPRATHEFVFRTQA